MEKTNKNNLEDQTFGIYCSFVSVLEQANDSEIKFKVLDLLLKQKDLCIKLIFNFVLLNTVFISTLKPQKEDLKNIRYNIKKSVSINEDFKELFAVLFQLTNYQEIYKDIYSEAEIFKIQDSIKKVLFHFEK